ncbi:YVTN family beta-propeller repeat protein [Castellaniella sp. S9]|uniref:YVTN family beta-propeller repeat protein n=1 Tax=Castellaniella sp. S9 TaxID=2993652 RepID=UPI0022B59C06|nr:cytochrome D1 domain-containing protein [Castellaniella sp. S9]
MLKLRPILLAVTLAFSASMVHASSLPNGVVYSANEGDGSISKITLSTGDVKTTQISVIPHNVQIAPDGKTLLAVGTAKTEGGGHGNGHGVSIDSHGDAGLLILDVDQLDKTLKTLPSGDHPAHVVTSPDGRYAYITNADANQLSVVDTQAGKLTAEIATGAYPHGLRLSPDGRELYVANVSDNSVSVIDPKTLKETARIAVGRAPVQVAFTKDGKQVYVSLRDENSVAVIDIATRKAINQINVGRGPIQLYAGAGDTMFVANQGSDTKPDNTISVIDTQNQSVIGTVVTGKGAHGVVASGDGKYVFVTNTLDNSVSAIDVGTKKVVATYQVGPNPNGITYRSLP